MSNVISAVFDDREQARSAVTELRSAGIPEEAISIVGRPDDDDARTDDNDDGASKSSIAGAVAGGGVAGALLGVAALAIPGVGPLAAAGAIAASAVPTAAGVGAAVGATGGAIARMLSEHDVDDDDAAFYEDRIQNGGVFVSVDSRRTDGSAEIAREILLRNGGQSAARAQTIS
jgi:uncharacterized membrane protein